ncbi:hypothetical protein [Rhizobium oryziradicis]|uniref:Uncharacterized protein n=1 Tax=Rhizobium oryziradicis TaxID=1867956 RepID=A0A1Q8ZRL0_9HYPH|nr:hypothetical protein [Rhizobium oryziradicis]OLP44713.1 hypothetical protein BJF95_09490 [Rhizobium oryziradicis]
MKSHSILLFTTITLALSAGIAKSDEVIDGYSAYIGQDDLYNSKGDRLTQPWQVIRQDRANYHKFGIRQDGDEDDSYFASEANRAKAEAMLAQGEISRADGKRILRGDTTIHVMIYGRGTVGRSLRVIAE